MGLIGDLIVLTGQLLRSLINIVQIAIIIHALFSWVGYSMPLNRFTRYFYVVIENLYRPIRSTIPTYYSSFDFTPLVALLILMALNRFIIIPFIRFGYQLGL